MKKLEGRMLEVKFLVSSTEHGFEYPLWSFDIAFKYYSTFCR